MFGLDTIVGSLAGSALNGFASAFGGNKSQAAAPQQPPASVTKEMTDGTKITMSGSEDFVKSNMKDMFQNQGSTLGDPTSLTPFSSPTSSTSSGTTSNEGSFVKLEDGATATITKAATKPA